MRHSAAKSTLYFCIDHREWFNYMKFMRVPQGKYKDDMSTVRPKSWQALNSQGGGQEKRSMKLRRKP